MKNVIVKLLFMLPMAISALLISLSLYGQVAETKITNVTIFVGGMMKSRSGATWLDWPDGVSAALVELAGIHDVEVFLDRDTFTVSYEPDLVDLEQITKVITKLGFEPKMITGEVQVPSPSVSVSGPVPEPLASTLKIAKEGNKLVFIDFFAEWCGPCIVMEETTLSDPMVKQALAAFAFLKVDTDVHPQVATHYNIVGMPTLLIVDNQGKEVWRQAGAIIANDLVLQLNNL